MHNKLDLGLKKINIKIECIELLVKKAPKRKSVNKKCRFLYVHICVFVDINHAHKTILLKNTKGVMTHNTTKL